MRSHRLIAFIGFLLSSVACAAVLVVCNGVKAEDSAAWKRLSEHWYILELGGGRAGWTHETVETDGEQFRTTSESSMRIGRMNQETSIYYLSEFLETPAGEPLSVRLTSRMSSQNVETLAVFKDDGIEQTVTQGGGATTRTLPRPDGEWLPPQALDRFLRTQHEAKARRFEYRTLQPENGMQPMDMTSEFVKDDTFKLGDREIPVTVWKTTVQFGGMPGIVSTEMYSSDDVLVYTETPMALGDLVMRLSSKKEATAESGEKVPELIFTSFITADRPLDDGLHARQARYRLTMKEGEMPPFPTAGAQRVTGGDVASVVLLTDMDDNVAAPEDDLHSDEYTQSSTLIDADNPLVEKLATRALRDAGDGVMARCEALRAFVYKYISRKNMGTAFASAGETAETRTGDCSEHAVLLAAMMRASNIPARVATGLVFMANRDNKATFGWHMWTQALVDGRWVDFDATLPVRFNAGHIMTSTSSFSDTSSASDLASLFLLMGNLEIEILGATQPAENAPSE